MEQEKQNDTRRRIDLGSMLIQLELDNLDNGTLLGMLLECRERSTSNETLERWKQIGESALEKT